MPFLRKRPRTRRPANLRIDYAFDRSVYVRWRLRSWAEARLRRTRAVLGHAVAASLHHAAAAVRRREPGRGPARYPRTDHATPSARPSTASA